jgi:hypothetical protein
MPPSSDDTVKKALAELEALKQGLASLETTLKGLSLSQASSSQASSPVSHHQEAPPQAEFPAMVQPETPALKPEKLPKPPKPVGWELNVGVKWFSRLGIVALLIGLAMAFAYSFPLLPSLAKVLLGGVFAAGLYFLGQRLYASAPLLGRILQGGGVSLGYLSVFAVFFIPGIALINSPGVGLLALLLYCVGAAYLAHRLQSQTMGILAVSYGYFVAAYTMCSLELSVTTFLPNGLGLSRHVAQALGLILSVVVLVLASLNAHWRVIAKLGFLQAILLPVFHSYYPSSFWEPYLWLTLLLYHSAALFSIRNADKALLALSGLGFYWMLWAPVKGIGFVDEKLADWWVKPGIEFVLSGLYVASFLVTRFWRRTPGFSGGTQAVLMAMALLFLGVGTARQWHGPLLPVLLSGEALLCVILARFYASSESQSASQVVLELFSLLFWAMAVFMVGVVYPVEYFSKAASHTVLFWSATWVYAVSVVMYAIYTKTKTLPAFIAPLLTTVVYSWLVAAWLPSSFITVAYVALGLLLLTPGFIWSRKFYRILGIFWLVLAIIRLSVYDIAFLAMPFKILVFVALGAVMLGASYGYSRLLAVSAQEQDGENATETPASSN